MDIKGVLFQWFINSLIKNLLLRVKFAGGAVKNKNISSKELAEELHKPFIRNIEKRKSYSSFIDIVWGCLSSRYTINK